MANVIEIQRAGVTESAFRAQCRYYMRKKGLEGWVDYVDFNWDEMKECRSRNRPEDTDGLYDEIFCETIGDVQYYLKPTEEGRKKGFKGYNFCYEFNWYDEKTGNGYLYVVDEL